MVIFNYQGIVKEANRLNLDNISLLRLLFLRAESLREQYKKTEIRLSTVLKGDNFLLDLPGLVNSNVDLAYKLMYLELIGLRSYSNYKVQRILGIETDLFPDLKLNLVKINPLLTLVGDHYIKFNLEESAYTRKN